MNPSQMFVSESSILSPSVVRLRISSIEGVTVVLEASPDTPVDQLKIAAVGQIYNPNEGYKLSLYYRLLHVASGRVLNEDSTLMNAAVGDNDELILLKKRVAPATLLRPSAQKEPAEKAPSVEEIDAATADLPLRHVNVQTAKPSNTAEFQKELRKILVTLIDVAQKLLCLNPDAIKSAAKFIPPEKKRSVARERSPPVNERSLAMLTSMGFDRARAARALRIAKMSEENAVQWLIDNPVETGPEADSEPPQGVATTSIEAEVVKDKGAEENNQYLKKQMMELAKLSGPDKVRNMLTAFQSNRRHEFKPDAMALQNLLEMGFEEDQVIEALRNSGNHQESACEWLLARSEASPSEPEVKEGLEVDGTVHRAILSNHVIQLALSNPKTLIALLEILENPHAMQRWLQDPELSPMLLQVSRIYHSEKYSQ